MRRIVAVMMAGMLAVPAGAGEIMSWEGFYAGVHAGLLSGNTDYVGQYSDADGVPVYGPIPGSVPLKGAVAGAQFGYNWAAEQFVLGVELDASWSNAEGSSPIEADPTSDAVSELNWLGSARLRAGMDLGRLMPYLTAGLAVVNTSASITNFQGFDDVRTVTSSFLGWTAGGGLEATVSDNVSLRVEYLYTDYGTQSVDYGQHNNLGPNGPYTLVSEEQKTHHAVRVGVNYRIN